MVVRELNQPRPVDATLDQRLPIRIRGCVIANRTAGQQQRKLRAK